jgi:hypothetical protein
MSAGAGELNMKNAYGIRLVGAVFIVLSIACGGEGSSEVVNADDDVGNEPSGNSSSCNSRTVETCVLDAQCYLVEASRFDPGQQCWAASNEAVGCADREMLCPDLVSYLRSPAGECWRFGGCGASGFVADAACAEHANCGG